MIILEAFETRREQDPHFDLLCQNFEMILAEAPKQVDPIAAFWATVHYKISLYWVESDINECLFIYLMGGYKQQTDFHWRCFEALRAASPKIYRAQIKNETAQAHGFKTASDFGNTGYGSLCNLVLGDTSV